MEVAATTPALAAEPAVAAPPAAAPVEPTVELTPEPTRPAAQPSEGAAGSDPWVLRLGNYLLNKKEPAADASEETPWAVRLGTYLEEKRPGPWSILANEKPHDPMVRPSSWLQNNVPCAQPQLPPSRPPDPLGVAQSCASLRRPFGWARS